ncbi:LLM class flavin-dependent oxidoreductase [Amycolatopsis sp. GM8]|uniref:LLM class flavin-dependent oxidoreductase n=1 Tax=Amycolatopsis sp. GM8 TaxID=2896530 RepID=UPI001F406873|nr:LLM class flavin-dependent oxidoreductase [Amycolatopsis sp. GM8]
MKVGCYFNFQNYMDWDRYLAQKPGPPEITDAQIYDEDLYLADLVEPLGFDSYWAIDHYTSPYAMTGGALNHLTYFAGRSSTLDLGTMVTVLPWHEPIHVAHQISMIDNILKDRRLTLGFGRGAAIREFDAFGIPMGESRIRYNEGLEVIKRSLQDEWFSFDGEIFKVPKTTVRPMYRNPERILERMRVAWTSPESLPPAAHGGLGMLMTGQKSFVEYGADVRNFNAIRAEHGWKPSQPTVIVRVACFEDEQEAWEIMRRYTLEGQRSSRVHYEFADIERFRNTKGYEQYAKLREHVRTEEEALESAAKPQAWGTPDQVFDRLLEIQRLTSAEEFVLSFRMTSMPVADAERSMRLFADQVLPRLHAANAAYNPEVGLSGTNPQAIGSGVTPA